MKRLLCIVNSMDTGGAETFLMKMYRHLDKTQYQMDFIVATQKECFYDKEIASLGGRLFHIPLHTEHPIEAFKRIKETVRDNKYDYVLKVLVSPIGVIDLYAAKRGGATHLCARSCNSAPRESFVRKVINTILRKDLCNITTVKLAPSDLAARYTFGNSAYEHNEVMILHNALDLEQFRFSENKRKRIREELGLGDSYVIGHIGRFTPQKNHDFLIRIFHMLKEKEANVKLVFIGTGSLQNDIRALCNTLGVQNDVIFTGVRDDVPDLLSAFDVFVLPSLYEGMPNACIEAQASGLRCLIGDTITKQADITGNVEYLPITDISLWVNAIMNLMKKEEIDRKRVNTSLAGSDYDINVEIDSFVNAVFSDKNNSRPQTIDHSGR